MARRSHRWSPSVSTLITALWMVAGCSTGRLEASATCGDGIRAGDEQCDGESNCDGQCRFISNCPGAASQACTIANGAGEQSRTCNDTGWSEWGACTVVACAGGYVISGNACAADCGSDCTNGTCGDGTVDTSAGEECDGELGCDPATCKPRLVEIIAVLASDDDGHGPAQTLDDSLDPESRWSAQGDPQFIEYGLSDVSMVGEIRLAVYKGDQAQAIFSVAVSVDDSTWSTVLDHSVSSGTTLDYETFTFPKTSASRVRIIGHGRVSGSLWNSFTEIRIEDFPIALPCTPNQNECGPDGCGGNHPECTPPESCVLGVCEAPTCVPNNNQCGADGCGGEHPACQEPESCVLGRCESSSFEALYQNNFEQRPLGKYVNRADFAADWNNPPSALRWGDFEIVTDPAGGANKVGRFTFPYYGPSLNDRKWVCWCSACFESDGRNIIYDFADEPTSCNSRSILNGVGPGCGGGEWLVPIGSHERVRLSYRVRFGAGFDAVGGGKLFGIASIDNRCGACQSTDCDGDGDADDFMSRLMFHSGSLSFYIYHYDKTEVCGDSISVSGSNVLDGQWHTILFETVMNTGDLANGSARVWIDGVERGSLTGLRFRKGDPSLSITAISITSFFGGDSGRLCGETDGGACGHPIPLSSQRQECAVNPADPCSDIFRYSDGSPFAFYAPRKTEYLYVDDIVAYVP